MALFDPDSLEWYQFSLLDRLAIQAVKTHGPVPQHLALIADGNRRYGRAKMGLPDDDVTTPQYGYQWMIQNFCFLSQWCIALGIRCWTLFGMHSASFRRPTAELADNEVLSDKLTKFLLQNMDFIRYHRIVFRFHGPLDKLPKDIQLSYAKVVVESSQIDPQLIVIFCYDYTTDGEIVMAINTLRERVSIDALIPHEVNCRTFSTSMYDTDFVPPVELLMRTSGKCFLSQYQLWQSTEQALVQFPTQLWPEFTLWQLVKIIWKFQRASSLILQTSNRLTQHLHQRDEAQHQVQMHQHNTNAAESVERINACVTHARSVHMNYFLDIIKQSLAKTKSKKQTKMLLTQDQH